MLLNSIKISILILSLPLGLILAKLTKDEKEIYKNYFPIILWILAIISSILLTLNPNLALTTISIFLLILTWNNSEKILQYFTQNFKSPKTLKKIGKK